MSRPEGGSSFLIFSENKKKILGIKDKDKDKDKDEDKDEDEDEDKDEDKDNQNNLILKNYSDEVKTITRNFLWNFEPIIEADVIGTSEILQQASAAAASAKNVITAIAAAKLVITTSIVETEQKEKFVKGMDKILGVTGADGKKKVVDYTNTENEKGMIKEIDLLLKSVNVAQNSQISEWAKKKQR